MYVYDEEKRKPKVAKQVFVNLRRNKRLNIPPSEVAANSKVVTCDNVVDAYARRKDFISDMPNEADGLLSDNSGLVDFVRTYGYNSDADMLYLLCPDAIVNIYPRCVLP